MVIMICVKKQTTLEIFRTVDTTSQESGRYFCCMFVPIRLVILLAVDLLLFPDKQYVRSTVCRWAKAQATATLDLFHTESGRRSTNQNQPYTYADD